MRKAHQDSEEVYGATKTWRALKQSGTLCGKHQVARLRYQAGIEPRPERKFRLACKARNTAPARRFLRRPFIADYPE
jgi:putative transposase